jgi:hypothetical protein
MEELQVERRNAILDEQHDFVISIRTGQTPQVTGQARPTGAGDRRADPRTNRRTAFARRPELVTGRSPLESGRRRHSPPPSRLIPGVAGRYKLLILRCCALCRRFGVAVQLHPTQERLPHKIG